LESETRIPCSIDGNTIDWLSQKNDLSLITVIIYKKEDNDATKIFKMAWKMLIQMAMLFVGFLEKCDITIPFQANMMKYRGISQF